VEYLLHTKRDGHEYIPKEQLAKLHKDLSKTPEKEASLKLKYEYHGPSL
jgi:hypothetical protein